MKKLILLMLTPVLLLTVGCGGEEPATILTLATTTSTDDSGLLDELLPIFEEDTGYEVDVIAVGTGQALSTGRSGDADVLLIHARELEEEFVADGYGTERFPVMYNDYIVLGPSDDPAGALDTATLEEALTVIYEAGGAGEATFASRGDQSGTHTKEVELWETFQLDAEDQDWYDSLGQGMGDTLVAANEMKAYALADRGTYLSMKDNLENLQIVSEGDDLLANPYGIIPVNPDTFDNVKYKEASELVEFFVRDDIQEKISEFGVEEFGQPLFFPDAD